MTPRSAAGAPDPLARPGEIERRIAALGERHMVPLVAHVEALRARYPERAVPHADPLDGGVRARALVLMEAPGPQSVATGFVSRDSPNPTARNLRALLSEAAIPRRAVLLWNVVPWYVGDGRRIRPVTARDIAEARAPLGDCLELLGRLETIVLVGRKAQLAEGWLRERRPETAFVRTFHPSPQVFHISPERKAATRQAFLALGRMLGERGRGSDEGGT